MAWQGLEGHDRVVERFAAAEARGRVAGSYLFIGPAGVGKGAFARKLAKALACHACTKGLVPCDGCASCVQAEAGSHPDIDVVEKPEDKSTIPIDLLIGDDDHRMRDGLCWRIKLRPALGTRKAAILLDADALGEEAANCLLKTLEEPPDGAVIILVGTALERQLPTIRSRCQIIRFAPLDTEIVRRVLQREQAAAGAVIAPALLDAAARGSGGSLARARLMLDPALADFREKLVGLLARRPLRGVELARETTDLIEAAGKEAPPRRARLRVVLDAAIDFYREGLRLATTGEQPSDPLLARALAGWAGEANAADQASRLLRHTLDAYEAIDRNANLTILIDAWTASVEQP
jgi:DNA polymerase-3 subunit delta'